MSRTSIIAFYAAGVFAATGLGMMSARADDASRLKLAQAVVEAAHADTNMMAVMPTMAAQMRNLLIQQGNAGSDQIDLFLKRFQQRFVDQIPQFSALVAEIYAKEFSEEDLGNLLAFYKTPSGQHLLAKQPELAKGFVLVGQKWGEGIAKDILAQMAKEKAAVAPPKL